MKSVWIDEWFTPFSTRSSGVSVARPLDRLQDRCAERDVRRRVLVVERVVEDEAGLADRRVAVDERDLAEPGRTFVGRHVRAHDVLARAGLHLDGAAAFEPDLEIAHDVPLDLQRQRRADVPSTRRESGVVKTSSVGMFATWSMPFEWSSAACHALSGWRPIIRSVPGPR